MAGGIYSESCESSTGEGEGKERVAGQMVAGGRCGWRAMCVAVGAIRGSTDNKTPDQQRALFSVFRVFLAI